ncbi:DHH family phosphoesterase [Corynebacterium vitaeruminis]|uniref:DHH family phosphoesterase n=1 Tax=Corynebacterium vitaeruminis TaxID=38305 RepID=UPI0005518D0E|nr:bifunctional oligoribonuclease/PAP phosphatase NrnA [Corynebacterium vitaeruminis]
MTVALAAAKLREAFESATRLVTTANKVAVVGHVNPDADAIGSVCATVAALGQLGIEARGVVGQRIPIDEELFCIPGASDIEVVDRLPQCDVVIVVDCGASSRTGCLQPEILANPERVVLVDHHATNRGFAGINLIDKSAESSTTVLREWFRYLDVTLDQTIAHCLYAGLCTDTDGFRWGRPQMHTLAKELVDTGLDIRKIGNELFDGGTVSDLVMIGRVLEDLRQVKVGSLNVVFAVASRDRIRGHSQAAVERIADMIRGVSDGDIVVVLKEYAPGDFAISFRSTTYDVSQVAKNMGGGGHRHSAGVTAFGTTEHVVARIIDSIVGECLRRI